MAVWLLAPIGASIGSGGWPSTFIHQLKGATRHLLPEEAITPVPTTGDMQGTGVLVCYGH